ncbi:MAG: aminoglycoside 3'-phosphotransferase [Actinobacteria bacterium]|nr:aminoglycoside 3'-phosphotransferase [Actinomycetota bacterium]
MELAHIPTDPVPVPPPLRTVLGADEALPVWRNQMGNLTFPVGAPEPTAYVKWVPAGSPFDLAAEAVRMRWAASFTPVPEVVEVGGDDSGSWLITRALPGETAVSARWTAEPARAVAAIGAGLRAFHDAVPVDGCPFVVDADARLATARARLDLPIEPRRFPPELQTWRVAELRAVLDDPPPTRPDDVVVGHGDGCAPNTIVGDDGRCVGHVDLGALGVTDRWADLAVASWSLGWNYQGDWEQAFYDAYGIDPDPDRIRYQRILWTLT